jgi:arylsulfatase A-like enzyme
MADRDPRMRLSRWIAPAVGPLAFGLALALLQAHPASAQTEPRPNILLIVADDMGYSDLASFGGEISTPNLDALAARGLVATNFYASPTCSPTRAMLLTGTDNHVAGLGNMAEFIGPEQKGQPGYEGYLNDRVASVASVLRDAGYHTYMAGKWHLGEEPEHWPAAKGFERDFTLMQGGGSNWSDMGYPDPRHPHLTFTRNGKPIDKLPDNHFSSAAFSDFIIESVDEQKDDGKPFFAYLSFQAVHSPFAVPDDWLDMYRGRYDAGYDAVREQRMRRMAELGLIGGDVAPFPRLPSIPAWDTLTDEQQTVSARKMEVYAAMLSNMDYHIGRVLDHLEAIGMLDNTLVIVMSDNGAESVDLLDLAEAIDPQFKQWLMANWDPKPENCGRKLSVCDYGAAWAQVGSGPYSYFKAYTSEGGIRVPLIVAGPGVEHAGDTSDALLHVTDVVPTLLEMAGVEHPSNQAGSKLAPVSGLSMVPLLAGAAAPVRTEQEWIGWELFGNRALRQGEWKALNLVKGAGGSGEWQLFNLDNDPSELHDLAAIEPERLDAMIALWDQYATNNGVILTGDGPFATQATNPEATVDEAIDQ